MKPPQSTVTSSNISKESETILSENVSKPSELKIKLDSIEKAENQNSNPPQPEEAPQEEMIDDEDFIDTSEDELDNDQEICRINLPADEMEHKSLLPCTSTSAKKPSSFLKSRLVKGLSLGNLKFPFNSPSASTSPKIKKSKSSSVLIDIEKDDEKMKMLLKNSTIESFDSSEESDLYFSMDHTKEGWHVDISNINYFLNQTGMLEQHQGVRNSMSPITKSTQRMPKSMQESIMTPRSRKPVMISMFANNSDPKSYQANISQLLEEPEEIPSEPSTPSASETKIPLNDIAAANDNGLPSVANNEVYSGGLSNAFK